MECTSCKTQVSSKWRRGLCNTCYASFWRSSERGRLNTRNLILKRRDSKEWKNYMQRYEKTRNRIQTGHITPNGRYSALKTKAKLKGWQVDLTKNEYLELLQRSCEYCQGPLNKSGVGLDRVDSMKGYIKGNVVPCCYTCNRFKNNLLTKIEMLEVVALLRKLRNGNLWKSI